MQLPLILTASITLAFITFGISFLAGLGVFLCAVIVNLIVGLWYNKVEKVVMACKDARMAVTTESINNAKMLKLYSWQDDFLGRIYRRRGREITMLKKRGIIVAIIIGSVYFFPSLLAPVTFSTFIGIGNTLDFNTAVAALVLFNLMRDPMISIPMFFSDLVECIVSMKRIQKFIDLHEVQKCTVRKNGSTSSETALEV